MTRPMTREHNIETGEVIEREMTDAEYETYQKMLLLYAEENDAKAKAATDKAALLAKLGITADEAKLLLS